MDTFIDANAAKLAGLQVDLLQKMREKKISLQDLEHFVRGELILAPPPIAVNPSEPALIEKPKSKMGWWEATKSAYDLMGLGSEYAHFVESFIGSKEAPNHWFLFLVKGVTCNKLATALKEAGSGFWSYYDDLDKSITHNDRDPNRDGSYAITIKAAVEADEENTNKSANMLAKKGHKGMTCMERLFLELVYFLMTGGEHLDIENITLCTGSRRADGRVPGVDFRSDDREVQVRWYGPDYRYGLLRSRSVDSLS